MGEEKGEGEEEKEAEEEEEEEKEASGLRSSSISSSPTAAVSIVKPAAASRGGSPLADSKSRSCNSAFTSIVS